MNIKGVTLLAKGEKNLAMTSTSEKIVEDRKKTGTETIVRGERQRLGSPLIFSQVAVN